MKKRMALLACAALLLGALTGCGAQLQEMKQTATELQKVASELSELSRDLPSFFNAIEQDGMLLIDEFSSGFHNQLETLLVRYFMEKSRYAQMFFVSHSTNLLSNSILRPDQEYAVEFCDGEGSAVRRFSAEQPRSAQNIEKMYMSGVFGGLPDYHEVDYEAQ